MTSDACESLVFSGTFLGADHLSNTKPLEIVGPAIVLNTGSRPIEIAGKPLRPWASSIYAGVVVPAPSSILRITLSCGFFKCGPFPFADAVINRWDQVGTALSVPAMRDLQLWRSRRHRVGDVDFNLWFATSGTDCGIHNEHPFREVHTQVFGLGRMQKFHSEDPDSLYEEVFMSPGYTHEPFYSEDRVYPWHQYHADTDCVWLAAERD